jgi:uncharacterized protein (DUF927 family)
VNVTTKSTFRAILADWLQQCGAGHEWIITHTTGWHHGAYIMPDGEVLVSQRRPFFNGRSAASSGYAVAGTAASWRDSVARLAGGNPSMMLGVAAALSAPLIGLVGLMVSASICSNSRAPVRPPPPILRAACGGAGCVAAYLVRYCAWHRQRSGST